MEDTDVKRLALAVVEQAVDDWRGLCKGQPESKWCNFKELERFFTHECDTFLTGTNISAERIYKQMLSERAKSKRLP